MAFLVVLSGAAIAAGSMMDWVTAREERPAAGLDQTSVTGLFRWSYELDSPFVNSFALVVLAAGVLLALGGLVRSRLITGLFSTVALAAAGLWIALNGSHYDPVSMPYSDLRLGAWLTLGGGLVGLIGTFFLDRSASESATAAALAS